MQINGKWLENSTVTDVKLASNAVVTAKIADANVTASKLDSTAKQSVLESKLIARRTGVLNFSTAGAVGSNVVTTQVEGAATVDTPRSDLTAKGIYVGSLTGPSDPKKVLLRAAGTDNGIDDGAGDDVYGVLTEATGVFTLTYKKGDGSAYTFSGSTAVDFFFVEIFDMYSQSAESGLIPVSGVVDATQASAINNHIGDTSAHDADSIDYESTGHTKLNIEEASVKVEAALSDLDTAIGALAVAPTNYTPANADIVADHLAGLDSAVGSAASAASNAQDAADDAQSDATDALNAIGTLAASPTNYTPSNAAIVADHLAAIDGKIGDIGEDKYEVLTLTSTDITNKYVDLAAAPKQVQSTVVQPEGGPVQFYTDDYTIITDGSVIKRLNWSGLGMDGILEVGDKLRVLYEVVA